MELFDVPSLACCLPYVTGTPSQEGGGGGGGPGGGFGYGYTIELRGGAGSGTEPFVLPEVEIVPTCEETYGGGVTCRQVNYHIQCVQVEKSRKCGTIS